MPETSHGMRRTTEPEGQAAPTAARAGAAREAERAEGMVAVMETEAQLPLQLHH